MLFLSHNLSMMAYALFVLLLPRDRLIYYKEIGNFFFCQISGQFMSCSYVVVPPAHALMMVRFTFFLQIAHFYMKQIVQMHFNSTICKICCFLMRSG